MKTKRACPIHRTRRPHRVVVGYPTQRGQADDPHFQRHRAEAGEGHTAQTRSHAGEMRNDGKDQNAVFAVICYIDEFYVGTFIFGVAVLTSTMRLVRKIRRRAKRRKLNRLERDHDSMDQADPSPRERGG